MTQQTKKPAVIYCRVSSKKQTKAGDGLRSQETRCRQFARYHGLDVVDVFADDMTGRFADRPGMQAMLGFLRKNRGNGYVVVIDDISRLARHIDAYRQLRKDIATAGGTLMSPSIEFKDDADSNMMENIRASVSQHQAEKNAEQTLHRMSARLSNGYWVFWKPRGYKYARGQGSGKILVRDEPIASIIKEALEGFATGRFATQSEVKRFLEAQPAYPKDFRNGEIRYQRIKELLYPTALCGLPGA